MRLRLTSASCPASLAETCPAIDAALTTKGATSEPRALVPATRRERLRPRHAPRHDLARHMQNELLELRAEVQHIGPRAVVTGEITGLEPRLPAVLHDAANALELDAHQHQLVASDVKAALRSRDRLAVGPDAREIELVATRRRDLPEERSIRRDRAIELDEGVAHHVAPELRPFAFCDRRRRHDNIHGTTRAPTPRLVRAGGSIAPPAAAAIAPIGRAPGNKLSFGPRQDRSRQCRYERGRSASLGRRAHRDCVRSRP